MINEILKLVNEERKSIFVFTMDEVICPIIETNLPGLQKKNVILTNEDLSSILNDIDNFDFSKPVFMFTDFPDFDKNKQEIEQFIDIILDKGGNFCLFDLFYSFAITNKDPRIMNKFLMTEYSSQKEITDYILSQDFINRKLENKDSVSYDISRYSENTQVIDNKNKLLSLHYDLELYASIKDMIDNGHSVIPVLKNNYVVLLDSEVTDFEIELARDIKQFEKNTPSKVTFVIDSDIYNETVESILKPCEED